MLKTVIPLTVIALCFFTSSFASADETEEAKVLFEKGKKLYRQEKYAEAADTFLKSYNKKPTWRLLYNIGQSEAAAKFYGRALDTFEKYMAEGGDDISPKRQEEVLGEIRRLRELVGSLEIKAKPGVLISVDGVEKGKAPLAGHVLVASGVDHQVTASSGGEVFFERKVRVSGGQTMSFEVPNPEMDEPAEKEELVSEETPKPAEPAQESSPKTLKTIGWISLGVGGAALIGGVVTGAMALSKNSEIEDSCEGTVCPPGEDSSLEKERDRMALMTDILLPVGSVLAATGITLLIIDSVKKKETSSAGLKPIAGPGVAGIMLQGSF